MDILKKVLEKVTDTNQMVAEQGEKAVTQQTSLDRMAPKLTDIRDMSTKQSKLLAKFHEKFSNSIKNDKKIQSSLNKNLTSLNKKYEKLVAESVEKIPKNLKETLKSDKSLMREIYLGVKNVNERIVKLGYTTRGIRTVQKNTKTQAPVVVNLGGPGGAVASEIAPLTRIDHNIEAIAQYMKVLSESLLSNPLRDKEGKEDYKALLEDMARDRRSGKRGRPSNDERMMQSGTGSITDVLLPGFIALSAFNHIKDYTDGYNDLGVRGAKLATGLLQPGGIKKPYEIIKDLIPKSVAKEGTETAVKETAKEVAETTSKSWMKAISKDVTEKTLKGASKVGKVVGKGVGKTIPLVGLGIGAAFALQRASEGDYKGASLEVLSGLLSLLPGFGTLVSIIVDGVIVARDIAKESKTVSEEMKRVVESAKRVASIAEEYSRKAEETGSDKDKSAAEYAKLKAEEEASRANLGSKESAYKKFKEENSSLPIGDIEKQLADIPEITSDNFEKTYSDIIDKDSRMSKVEKDTLKNSKELKEYYSQQIIESNRKNRLSVIESSQPGVKEAFDSDVKTTIQTEQDKEYEDMKNTLVEYIKFFSNHDSKYVSTPYGEIEYIVDENGKQVSASIANYGKDIKKEVRDILDDSNKKKLIEFKNPSLLELVNKIGGSFGSDKKKIRENLPALLDRAVDSEKQKEVRDNNWQKQREKYTPRLYYPDTAITSKKMETSELLASNSSNSSVAPPIAISSSPTTNISSNSYPTHISTIPDFGYSRDQFNRIRNK